MTLVRIYITHSLFPPYYDTEFVLDYFVYIGLSFHVTITNFNTLNTIPIVNFSLFLGFLLR